MPVTDEMQVRELVLSVWNWPEGSKGNALLLVATSIGVLFMLLTVNL
jgi:hypothetical protein